MAEACGALDIPLVHVSTDYVFDGEKRSPYLETDAPNPLSVYGATKLAGDRAIEQAAPRRWAILRTSWVVSEIGETFPVKLLRRAKAGEPLRVVDDQWGCPTAASDLARAMQTVGSRLLDDDAAAAAGLFFLRGASEMSWHGFADRPLSAAETIGLARHRCRRSRVPSSTLPRGVPLTRSSPARASGRHSVSSDPRSKTRSSG